jgi:hypothetical protein
VLKLDQISPLILQLHPRARPAFAPFVVAPRQSPRLPLASSASFPRPLDAPRARSRPIPSLVPRRSFARSFARVLRSFVRSLASRAHRNAANSGSFRIFSHAPIPCFRTARFSACSSGACQYPRTPLASRAVVAPSSRAVAAAPRFPARFLASSFARFALALAPRALPLGTGAASRAPWALAAIPASTARDRRRVDRARGVGVSRIHSPAAGARWTP